MQPEELNKVDPAQDIYIYINKYCIYIYISLEEHLKNPLGEHGEAAGNPGWGDGVFYWL